MIVSNVPSNEQQQQPNNNDDSDEEMDDADEDEDEDDDDDDEEEEETWRNTAELPDFNQEMRDEIERLLLVIEDEVQDVQRANVWVPSEDDLLLLLRAPGYQQLSYARIFRVSLVSAIESPSES